MMICIFNITFGFAADAVILINNDESETRTTAVELSINHTNAVRMRFANDRMSGWSEWESFSETKSWSLSEGDGTKVVYIEIEDANGKTSIYSDKILLEKYPRSTITLRWGYIPASIHGYAIYLWDGYAYREIDRVSQDELEWSSDQAKVYPTEESLKEYEPNSVTYSLFTTKGKGKRLRNTPASLYNVMQESAETKRLKALYENNEEMKYEDTYFFKIGAINEHDEIILSDPIPTQTPNVDEAYNMPPEVSIIINDGAGETTDRNVVLGIEASDFTTKQDDLMMRFANDIKENWSEWESFSATRKWELSEGEGLKTVFVQVKDNDEDVTTDSDKITLKQLMMEKFEVSTRNGAHATTKDTVILKLEMESVEGYSCSYKIDDETKNVAINKDGEIEISLIKDNRNKIEITLTSADGKKIWYSETEIWKLQE